MLTRIGRRQQIDNDDKGGLTTNDWLPRYNTRDNDWSIAIERNETNHCYIRQRKKALIKRAKKSIKIRTNSANKRFD